MRRPITAVPRSTRLVAGWAALSAGLAVCLGALILSPGVHVPQIVPGADKIVHVCAFAVLILPGAALAPHSLRWLAPALLGFALASEYLQGFVGRNACIEDAAANAAGLALGIALGLAAHGLARTHTAPAALA